MCLFKNSKSHNDMANAIRFLSVDMIEKANSGHPGLPLGIADVATVLFSKFIKVSTNQAKWFDRDRFVLSAGHGSAMLYSVLYLMGYKDISIDDLKDFRQLGAKTAGHPEYGHLEAIDTTTGPLGQGITTAVGMALAERNLNAKVGSDLCNHYTYTILGDGCLMEGISEEAISFAGHFKLNKLIAFWDNNEITIDGRVNLSSSTNQVARFKANGWNVISINGHSERAITKAIKKAQKSDKPTLIDCKTVIGYGAPSKQNTSSAHGSPLGEKEMKALRENLGWKFAPFEVPVETLSLWRESAKKADKDLQDWKENYAKSSKNIKDFIEGKLSKGFDKALNEVKKLAIKEKTKVATRKASNMCLEALIPNVDSLVGGSADLTGPNLTSVKNMTILSKDNYAGKHIHYGIREHAMGAIMNGMSLHGGILPYGGTFFVFSDYMRPAMRLAALMKQKVVYVLTHDSIGVGEDGATHQPIEHLMSFRAMPNILVFRPCDVVETAEAWQLALIKEGTPSVLALTRQNLDMVRTTMSENLTAKGAYVISDVTKGKKRQATIIATGSEVSIAIKAQEELKAKKVEVAVVSMPCMELFEEQDIAYQTEVLGTAPRIAVEAGAKLGWERYVGENGDIIGMDGFGASAPGSQIYEHFGITAEEVIESVENNIKKKK